ncbi:translation initiation factor IF-5A [Methanocella sp. CWC-04]|uniref:Translation initiation factor 5A n=1 Tax=Methanooceanicella nereidis TaxID=2052831 RepID=A0AAP2W6M5_9EURY|nr:translation initiation factor IF-5A [Methanocella sp. CWC-04]MCD1295498.1 translation initiation factor IF-5A [Methanocella sp. CWC-04]
MKQQSELGSVKEGKYLLIDEEPCVAVSVQHSKPGKHGAAKARVDAVGIFDGSKRSIVQPVSARIYVPVVERKSAQVLSISGDVAQLMDTSDFSTFELPIPEDLKDKVVQGEEIQYISSMGKMKIQMR